MDKHYRNRLKRLCKKRGITNVQIAVHANIHRNTVTAFFAGQNTNEEVIKAIDELTAEAKETAIDQLKSLVARLEAG